MAEVRCGFDNAPNVLGRDLLIQFGPTLLVDVGFDPDYSPDSGKPPIAGMKGIHALVDTGATESCIDNQLAQSLNLPVVDRRPIAGAFARALT